MQPGSPVLAGRRRRYRHTSVGAMFSPCAAHCFLRAILLLVCLFLLGAAAQGGAAVQRVSASAGTATSAEGTEGRTDLPSRANASAAQRYVNDEHASCPALPFSFYVAAAMGMWSRIDRLASCPSTGLSTVLDDIRLSREARTSGGALLSELWRRARGIREESLFYDNAAEFIALETEIKRFVRANHTLGMHPPHYGDVLSSVADILGLNLTADLLPPHGDGPLPIMADGPGVESVDQECESDPICLQRGALNAYRRHANRTLEASPHLIVSDATFAQAMAYYQNNLVPSIVVRAYDLMSGPLNSFEHDLAGFLRTVQQMWDAATREVEREEEDAAAKDETVALRGANITDSSKGRSASSSLSQPFLPFIKVTDFTGPPMLSRARSFFHDRPEPPLRGSGSTPQRPLHRVLPAAIVYHTSPSCASCEVYDRAFDLLPSLFKGLCSRPHVSMISCSPLTLFLRTTQINAFDLVPSMDIYARLVYSREAVLRTADASGFFFSGGSADAVDDDDAADDARFYSLKSKYGSHRHGIEREVLPRDQFTPNYVSLRQISDGTSVEEALTSMFAELVKHGVVQFAFIGKSQLNRILKKNQEVLERLEQRRHEEEGNAQNGTDAAAASSPPTPNPEVDPEYQKVVTFHDLAAELVSSYIKSHFGDVTPSMTSQEWTRPSAWPTASSWWLLSWLINAVAALWDCVWFELERPLVPILFMLVFTAQLLWNRVEQVTYW